MCPAHCSQEAAWDHERDLRKHDTFTRLDPAPFSPAVDVVIAVKNEPNIHRAAGLIEAYVASEMERVRLDAVAAGARP